MTNKATGTRKASARAIVGSGAAASAPATAANINPISSSDSSACPERRSEYQSTAPNSKTTVQTIGSVVNVTNSNRYSSQTASATAATQINSEASRSRL